MKRQIRSRLDLFNTILTKKVLDAQNKQKMHHNYHARDRIFEIGDPVLCQNYGRGDELLPGHIIVKSGPVLFQIKLNDGCIIKRHRHCAEEPRNKLPEVAIPLSIPMTIQNITPNSTITTPIATRTQFSPIRAKPVYLIQ